MNRKACSVQTLSVGILLRMLFRWLEETRRRKELVSSWVSYLATSGQDPEFSHASSLSHFHFIACPPRFPPQPPIRPLYMSVFTNKGENTEARCKTEFHQCKMAVHFYTNFAVIFPRTKEHYFHKSN
jgi:hypothetical protein